MSITFYTIEEVAQILKVNPAKVRQLIASGQLTSARVGKQYRISQQSLDEYSARVTR